MKVARPISSYEEFVHEPISAAERFVGQPFAFASAAIFEIDARYLASEGQLK